MRAARPALLALLLAVSIAAPARGAGAPPEFYGVVSQAALPNEDFPKMAANGVGLIRLQFSWKYVQPTEGECDSEIGLPIPPGVPGSSNCQWNHYDRVFGAAAASGIEVMPYFLNVPPWISEHENAPPTRSEADREAWTNWLQIVVRRYGPGGSYWTEIFPSQYPGVEPLPIGRWQIWNEPSDGTFWHPEPNAAEYGDLVELSAAAIHGVDPSAEVVLAGVFGTPNESAGGIDAKPYLRALFRSRDLSQSVDSLALHPYGPNLKRSLTQVKNARKVFIRAGFGDRPLWITEIGWASGGDHAQLSKTPAKQASLLTKAYAAYEQRRAAWNIAGVTWFAWQDTDTRGACAFCTHVGLVTVDRQEKPALAAYRVAATGV